jgi:hypothetical protein
MRRTAPAARLAPFALAALLPLLLAGCGRRDTATSKAPEGEHAMTLEARVDELSAPVAMRAADAVAGNTGTGAASVVPASPALPAAASRMLVRNVSLALVVHDVDSAAVRVEAIVTAGGGFVASSNTEERGSFRYRHYSLRMPADRLGGALEALRGLAVKVTNESQSVQDVTDQAVDVQARLRTLRATEDELIALLREARERGRKVDDVMAIYRELTGIRTQIEQYQGQLQSLQNLAALSTVTVQLAPDAATAPLQAQGWRPMETVKNSLRQLVTALRGVADFAIWAALVLLPIGALVAGLVALLLALVRRVVKRRSAA